MITQYKRIRDRKDSNFDELEEEVNKLSISGGWKLFAISDGDTGRTATLYRDLPEMITQLPSTVTQLPDEYNSRNLAVKLPSMITSLPDPFKTKKQK